MLNGNTLENPRLLEQVEPKEGKFDFTALDELLASARRHEMKLILLWFASWKNGNMDYAPSWVKTDTNASNALKRKTARMSGTFPPTVKLTRKQTKRLLSPFASTSKPKDSAARTVIAVQIENEQGIHRQRPLITALKPKLNYSPVRPNWSPYEKNRLRPMMPCSFSICTAMTVRAALSWL